MYSCNNNNEYERYSYIVKMLGNNFIDLSCKYNCCNLDINLLFQDMKQIYRCLQGMTKFMKKDFTETSYFKTKAFKVLLWFLQVCHSVL